MKLELEITNDEAWAIVEMAKATLESVRDCLETATDPDDINQLQVEAALSRKIISACYKAGFRDL